MNKACAAVFILLFTSIVASSQSGSDFLGFVLNRSIETTEKSASINSAKKAVDLICPIGQDAAAKKVLVEYGAMFVAAEKVKSPPTCIFRDGYSVAAFQLKLDKGAVTINGTQMVFQSSAAESLNDVLVVAKEAGIRMIPLDGAIAGGRSYSDSVRLWNSRFMPALNRWTARQRISRDEAQAVLQMSIDRQIERLIDWESHGMWFGTSLRGSIFSSTAPPGASQHLSLIAVDLIPVTPSLIALMNSHGWFQTVKGDQPHFTYLGLSEKELPGRGLKAVIFERRQYWVPNIPSEPAPSP